MSSEAASSNVSTAPVEQPDEPVRMSDPSNNPILAPQFTQSGIVTVYVGPKRKMYEVHKALMCAESKFFERCLELGFQEGNTGEVYLPEDSPAAFETILSWIYHGFVVPKTQQDVERSLRTYPLLHRLLISSFMNALMDTFCSTFLARSIIEKQAREWLAFFSEHNLEECPVYIYLIRAVTATIQYKVLKHSNVRGCYFELQLQHWSSEDTSFLRKHEKIGHAVLLRLLDNLGRNAEPVELWPSCQFRDHSDGSTCPRRR